MDETSDSLVTVWAKRIITSLIWLVLISFTLLVVLIIVMGLCMYVFHIPLFKPGW